MSQREGGCRRWYNEHYHLHRLDGPAVIYPSGRKEWWAYGKLHRLDGPAIEIVADKILYGKWYVNGVNISNEVEEWLCANGYEYPFTQEVQFEFKLKWCSDG